MLVVVEIEDVYFHFCNHGVFIPSCPCYHPSIGEIHVAGEREIRNRQRFKVRIAPEKLEQLIHVINPGIFQVITHHISVFVIACAEKGSQFWFLSLAITCPKQLIVRSSQINPLVGNKLLRRIIDIPKSHTVKNPERVEIGNKPGFSICSPLMKCMARIPEISRRQKKGEKGLCCVLVHFGDFIINSNTC